jgi:hypothetical protein
MRHDFPVSERELLHDEPFQAVLAMCDSGGVSEVAGDDQPVHAAGDPAAWLHAPVERPRMGITLDLRS